MRKVVLGLAALLSAALLEGCAGGGTVDFSPAESSIYVSREGIFSSATLETFENKEYYDQEGLAAYVRQNVEEFNQAKEGRGVAVRSASLSEGKAMLIFDYSSGEELAEFTREFEDTANQVENIRVSTVAEAAAGGQMDGGSFVKVKDKSAVPLEAVTKEGGLHAVTVEGAVTLQTEGRILYVSEGVSVADDHTVKTPADKSYVIFQ